MKKVLMLVILGLALCGNTGIRVGNTGGQVISGYEFYQMEVRGQEAPTSNNLVWYADNILGYSSVGIEGIEVSTGNVPTTINAVAIYSTGQTVSSSSVTITAGTDLTKFLSAFYMFTLPAYVVTRDVTFNFMIAD